MDPKQMDNKQVQPADPATDDKKDAKIQQPIADKK